MSDPSLASRRATAGAWVVLAVVAAFVILPALRFDFRERPVAGDEVSHLLQILSLVHDRDLHFGVEDYEHWRDLGWTPEPLTIRFQRYSHGFAFAKPYGYSLFAAPFAALLGAPLGVVVANASLLLLAVGCGAAMLRRTAPGWTVPLLLGAFFFGCYPYFYLYAIHTELFLVALTAAYFLAALRHEERPSSLRLVILGILFAFGVSEKLYFVFLYSPVLLLALHRADSQRIRFIAIAASATAFVVFVVPYLHYSDGQAWNPYGGARFHAGSWIPFAPGADPNALEGLSPIRATIPPFQQLLTSLLRPFVNPGAFAKVAIQYVIGAHTGIFVFTPVAALLVIAVVMRLRDLDPMSVAILLGLGAYCGAYILLVPWNYYGGANSLGNRYFLQASAGVLALVAAARLDGRILATAGLSGLVVSFAFLWPHHLDPSSAFRMLSRTSPLQRVMPFDATQAELRHFGRRIEPLNPHLFPWPPRWHLVAEGDPAWVFSGSRLAPVDAFGTFETFNNLFTHIDPRQRYWRVEFGREKIYAGAGFYAPEASWIWSQRESSLLFESPAAQAWMLAVHPFADGTNVSIRIRDKVWKSPLPVLIELVPGDAGTGTLRQVEIIADVEGSPSELAWEDHRVLSFMLRAATPEDRFHIRPEQTLRVRFDELAE